MALVLRVYIKVFDPGARIANVETQTQQLVAAARSVDELQLGTVPNARILCPSLV